MLHPPTDVTIEPPKTHPMIAHFDMKVSSSSAFRRKRIEPVWPAGLGAPGARCRSFENAFFLGEPPHLVKKQTSLNGSTASGNQTPLLDAA
jgi:hypothetical protein